MATKKDHQYRDTQDDKIFRGLFYFTKAWPILTSPDVTRCDKPTFFPVHILFQWFPNFFWSLPTFHTWLVVVSSSRNNDNGNNSNSNSNSSSSSNNDKSYNNTNHNNNNIIIITIVMIVIRIIMMMIMILIIVIIIMI